MVLAGKDAHDVEGQHEDKSTETNWQPEITYSHVRLARITGWYISTVGWQNVLALVQFVDICCMLRTDRGDTFPGVLHAKSIVPTTW